MKMWANLITLAMKFLLNIINIAKEKLINLWVHNSRPPPPTTVELESNPPVLTNISVAAGQHNDDEGNHGTIVDARTMAAGHEHNDDEGNHGTIIDARTMLWIEQPLVVIGVCLAAISAALQALQITGPLPLKSQLVYVALVIFFTCVLAYIYLRSNYTWKWASDVLQHAGVLFGATALVVALVINLNTPLMVTSLATFLSGIFIVIIARLNF